MKDSTEKKLKAFAGLPTWSSEHPDDTERFYQFTAEAYRQGDASITFDEFNAVFREAHGKVADEDKVHEFYSRYSSAIEAIRVFETGRLID